MSRLVIYNAGPPSKTRPGDASRCLGGLLREYGPRVAVACEVGGDRLEPFPGYWLVRDTSRAGRANMAAYVRDDVALRRTWWIDHQTRWPRTERPGIHPARSTLVLSAGNAQILGAHNLPLHTQNTREGQLEIVHAVELVMNPWKRPRIRERVPDTQAMRDRPRMLLWDDNAPAGSRGLGSTYLAPRIGGHRHGRHIDNGCGRRMPVDHVDYVTHAGGVRMTTDHPWGACVIHLEPKTVRWSL